MLLVYAIGIAIAFTTLQARVGAVEAGHDEISDKIDNLQILVERIIIVEERSSYNHTDILEIKQDVKDLKDHFNLE